MPTPIIQARPARAEAAEPILSRLARLLEWLEAEDGGELVGVGQDAPVIGPCLVWQLCGCLENSSQSWEHQLPDSRQDVQVGSRISV